MATPITLQPLSERKIEILLKAQARGEKIDAQAVRHYTKSVSPVRISGYLDAVAEKTGAAPPNLVRPVSSETARNYVLADDTGIETELEVVRETTTTVVLRKVSERLVTVMVKGCAIRVDINSLRRMQPDDVHQGVKVAALLAASEIA